MTSTIYWQVFQSDMRAFIGRWPNHIRLAKSGIHSKVLPNIHCMISGICSAFIEHPITPVPGPTQSRSLFPGIQSIQITAEQQNINITHCAPLGSPAFRAWPITTSRTKKNHWVIYTKKREKKEKKREKGKTAGVLPILGMLLILFII